MPDHETTGEEWIKEEGITKTIEITGEQECMPGEAKRSAEARDELPIAMQPKSWPWTRDECDGSSMSGLPIRSHGARGTGQLDNLAVDESSTGQRRLIRVTARALSVLRTAPARTMTKHMTERVTRGVAKGVSRETAAAEVAADVLRLKRSRSEKCEGDNK
jgi:hypothetical protein